MKSVWDGSERGGVRLDPTKVSDAQAVKYGALEKQRAFAEELGLVGHRIPEARREGGVLELGAAFPQRRALAAEHSIRLRVRVAHAPIRCNDEHAVR